ncbi:MAG: PH domain-containing protein [Elusimicrobia bacterium]|nr:PH domain-containing protein [Elusimicrobiota bacterium]
MTDNTDGEMKLVATSTSFKNWPKCFVGGALLIMTGILLLALDAFAPIADLLVAFAGVGLIAWAAVNVANTHYCVTNNRIIAQSGLLKGRSAEAELRSVKGISVRQTPIQESLGVGDLLIDVGSAAGPLVFEGVNEPEKLRERILSLK